MDTQPQTDNRLGNNRNIPPAEAVDYKTFAGIQGDENSMREARKVVSEPGVTGHQKHVSPRNQPANRELGRLPGSS